LKLEEELERDLKNLSSIDSQSESNSCDEESEDFVSSIDEKLRGKINQLRFEELIWLHVYHRKWSS
jgi:hypothetical protein